MIYFHYCYFPVWEGTKLCSCVVESTIYDPEDLHISTDICRRLLESSSVALEMYVVAELDFLFVIQDCLDALVVRNLRTYFLEGYWCQSFGQNTFHNLFSFNRYLCVSCALASVRSIAESPPICLDMICLLQVVRRRSGFKSRI